MIPSGALTSGVAVITLAAALPTVTGASTRLDATTQTVNIGNTNSGTLGTGGSVGVDNVSLPHFPAAGSAAELRGERHGADAERQLRRRSSASHSARATSCCPEPSGTARNNLVGMTATGSSADDSPAAYGIAFSASGATIRNNFVTVNNSAIRSDSGGTGSTISSTKWRARRRATPTRSTASC